MSKLLKEKAINLFNKQDFQKSLNILIDLSKTEPKSIDVLMYIAFNLMQLHKYNDAASYLKNIITLNKNLPQIFYNLAICFGTLGKYKEAIDNYKKAISIKKDYFEAYIQLGQLLKKINLLDDAITVYKTALTQGIQTDSIYVNISELYYLKKNYQLSMALANEALNLNPKNYLAMINIANCLMEKGEVANGIIELEKAKNICPNSPMIFNNLGFLYKQLENDEKATENYIKAIELNPKLHDAHFNLSHIQLSQNNFKEGWHNYEYRWGVQKKFSLKLNFNKPQWNENLGFDRILIWGEQGIGEQILFSSIIPDISSKFKKVLICVEDKLVKLFQKKFIDLKVCSLSNKINENEFDYHLPICSLAKVFRNHPDYFNQPHYKYLQDHNNPKRTNKKLRCALSWKSTNKDLANYKSIKLEDLKEILLLDDIDFFDIQYTNEEKEVSAIKKKHNIDIYKDQTFDSFNDLYELSEFIKTCDFVVTVSNTNAHISAFMGVPTYILLPKTRGKFWYWENDINGQNLWYSSIVKFKQEKQNEWLTPINNLKNYLIQRYYLNSNNKAI